jgi:hypothetical protein
MASPKKRWEQDSYTNSNSVTEGCKDLSDTARLNLVRQRIQLYRQSIPGDDDAGGNQGLGTLMRAVENYGQDGSASVDTVDRTLQIIAYRLKVMEMADKYVKKLGIDGLIRSRAQNGIGKNGWKSMGVTKTLRCSKSVV